MSPSTNQYPTFYRPDALPVAQSTVSQHIHAHIWQLKIWKIGMLRSMPKVLWSWLWRHQREGEWDGVPSPSSVLSPGKLHNLTQRGPGQRSGRQMLFDAFYPWNFNFCTPKIEIKGIKNSFKMIRQKWNIFIYDQNGRMRATKWEYSSKSTRLLCMQLEGTSNSGLSSQYQM